MLFWNRKDGYQKGKNWKTLKKGISYASHLPVVDGNAVVVPVEPVYEGLYAGLDQVAQHAGGLPRLLPNQISGSVPTVLVPSITYQESDKKTFLNLVTQSLLLKISVELN